jgi:ABC-type transport system involved in cytochrome c biogenesis permease subunit
MSDTLILSYITFVYFFSFLGYLMMMIMGKEVIGRAASWIALIGLLGHSAGMIYRWVESYRLGIGHAPLSNLYESLIFFPWAIVLLYLVM